MFEYLTQLGATRDQLVAGEPLADSLNTLGADGWELVAVMPHTSGSFCFIFKRVVS